MSNDCDLNINNIISKSFKYLFMGLFMVMISLYVIKTKLQPNEILILAISSTFLYSILDMYSYDVY